MDKSAFTRRISAAMDSRTQPVKTPVKQEAPQPYGAHSQNLPNAGQQPHTPNAGQQPPAHSQPNPNMQRSHLEPAMRQPHSPPPTAYEQPLRPLAGEPSQESLESVYSVQRQPDEYRPLNNQHAPASHFDPIAELNVTLDRPVESQVQITEPAPLMSFKPQPSDTTEVDEASTPRMAKDDRPEAYVIACDGNMAIIQGDTNCVDTITGLTWAVGRMLSIHVGESRIVGMICDIKIPDGNFRQGLKSLLHFKVELQGEVKDGKEGDKPSFVKGITSYPGVGSVVHQIRADDLASIYAATGSNNGVIGHLSQDESIPAFVDIPDMLSKHFAVLGSTGCGKSASVSLLLHCAQELIPDLRTVILDPHNEYSRAFPQANTVAQAELDLPFWMFQLEEYVEVLFRGKPLVHEEVDALREFIPIAKARFLDGEERVNLRPSRNTKSITADTAVPYRMADLIALIDDEMGLLESQFSKNVLKNLKARIAAHSNDTRYAFMFRHKTIEDIAQRVIGNFFCLPGNGSFSTIIQMAGMPAEVVNSVASVLCRLSFELAIAAKGNLKVLVVCEEAHRYVPAGKGGFEPTRRAIARIAKEGRKYGSFIGIISQRPSELDPTILSQCSTVFSLRLTNDFDQDIIRRAISSSSASTIAFISSLSNRECIAFGEGMSTPMRMKFRNLPGEWLPGAEANVFGNSNPIVDAQQSDVVFQSWRSGATQ